MTDLTPFDKADKFLVEARQLKRNDASKTEGWCRADDTVVNPDGSIMLKVGSQWAREGDWIVRRGKYWTVMSDSYFKDTYEFVSEEKP
jgi:hypothetical protein